MTTIPCKAAEEPSVDRLACDNHVVVTIDAAEYVYLAKVVLTHDYFTAWIGLTIERGALKRHPNLTINDEWGIGYQLDQSEVTGIHPLVRASSATIALVFPHLKAGPHRLRLGLLNRIGELTQDNAYCFTAPGRFTLTSQ
jgi:hypothetical protein